MDDQTIEYILKDKDIDPVSNIPFATIVYMLYYGLELKHFLTDISEEMIEKFDLGKHEVGDYSVYRSGSVAQGFYLNTNYLPDARDIDVVAISHRYDIRERCNYNEEIDVRTDVHEIVDLWTTEHESYVRNNEDSCIVIGQCRENEDPYFNVKVLQDTPPGYVLIERCRRHRKTDETKRERFVSSLKATEARVKFWSDLQPLIKQKFDDTEGNIEDQESSLFSFVEPHGPAATTFMSLFESTTPFETDFVYCVPYPKPWPDIAAKFLTRERKSGWPSKQLIEQIFRDGCTLIPKGELGSKMEDYEWRISFTGEIRLARSLNRTQRELIHAFKALISECQHPYDFLDISTSVESYHLLTLMYYESELVDPSVWVPQNIAKMMFVLLDKYLQHFEMRYLPHFMISSRNIFAKYRDLSKEEADTVLYTIIRLRRDPIGQIVQQEKYLNLPAYLHKWAFDPIVDSINLNVNKQLHPIRYVQSLLRLSKAHLLVNQFDKALIYSRDAQRFFFKIAEKDTTVHDFIDLYLTLALCLQRNGEIADALYAINIIRKTIITEEDNIDGMTSSIFYRLSARFKFNEQAKNLARKELDFNFVSDYMKSLALLQYSQDIAIEGMYITMLAEGPDKVKEMAINLDRYLPGTFDDIVNAKDVKIIYDRKQQVCLQGGTRIVDGIEARDTDADISPITDDLLWTAFGVKTDAEYDLPLKAKNELDTTVTSDTDPLGGFHVGNEGVNNAQTKLSDMTDSSTPQFETKNDEHFLVIENQRDTVINGMSRAPFSPFEQDMEISEDNGKTTDSLPEQMRDNKIQEGPKERIIYDRRRFFKTTRIGESPENESKHAEEANPETSGSDDEFTDADVNMVDARLVQELCRVKLFKNLKMQEKSTEVLQRLNSKIEKSRKAGTKVNIRMVERALEMYIEAARAIPKTEYEISNIIDRNHIYFNIAEKPYLDQIIQEVFNRLKVKLLVIPFQIVLFHTKLLYFTKNNMFEEAEAVFRRTESFIDNLEDVTDRRISECIIELHRTALSEHFCVEVQLSEDFEYETDSLPEELSVKKQVFKWIKAVFETMIKYEPKNKYLDEVFTNG